jgi:trehalose synthase
MPRRVGRHMIATMATLSHVPVGALSSERFGSVLPVEDYERFLRVMQRGREVFDGRVVWNVNSTARGGGVAEMLVSLLACARGAGVDARWVVIAGNEAFFEAPWMIVGDSGVPASAGSWV